MYSGRPLCNNQQLAGVARYTPTSQATKMSRQSGTLLWSSSWRSSRDPSRSSSSSTRCLLVALCFRRLCQHLHSIWPRACCPTSRARIHACPRPPVLLPLASACLSLCLLPPTPLVLQPDATLATRGRVMTYLFVLSWKDLGRAWNALGMLCRGGDSSFSFSFSYSPRFRVFARGGGRSDVIRRLPLLLLLFFFFFFFFRPGCGSVAAVAALGEGGGAERKASGGDVGGRPRGTLVWIH